MQTLQELHRAHKERLARLAPVPNKIESTLQSQIQQLRTDMEAEISNFKERLALAEAAIRRTPETQAAEEPAIFPPTMAAIKRATCKFYGITEAEMVSSRRDGDVLRARHVAIFLCRNYTSRSLPEIAYHFGKRDHTTIMNANERVKQLCEVDKELVMCIESIKRALIADGFALE